MNRTRSIILLIALVLIGLILLNDLPVEFPWVYNIVMLYIKVCLVLAVAITAYIFCGKKKPLEKDEQKVEG